jgi:hypothetical protein
VVRSSAASDVYKRQFLKDKNEKSAQGRLIAFTY